MNDHDRPVRVALVGCGAIGELVARQVYAHADPAVYSLAAAIDRRADRAKAVAAALEIPAFPSVQAAVDAGVEIDAADIRTPHAAHAGVACDLLVRGLAVLIEKPLATTMADALRIQDAAAASGRVAAVAENYPHLKAVRAARDAIRAGTVGEVLGLRSTRPFTLDGVWLRDGWRRGDGPSSGLLLDQGTHHTSLLRFLGGPITQVAAEVSRSAAPATLAPSGDPGVADHNGGGGAEMLMLTVRFASGLAAQSVYSWTAFPLRTEPEGTVFGSRGRIDIRVSYDAGDGGARLWDADHPEGRALGPAENYYDSHRYLIEDWVSAIQNGGSPLVSVADGLADLAVVLAAARSLDTGGQFIDVTGPVPADYR